MAATFNDDDTSTHERRLIEDAEREAKECADEVYMSFSETHEGDQESQVNVFPGYRIVSTLGIGAQGIVYEGIDENTGRAVAIKVMKDDALLTQSDMSRFQREARILARLKHPNIVTVHHAGKTGPNPYFVMDYIRGESLDDFVKRSEVSIEKNLQIFAMIADAVGQAHLYGIVHRDLKPSNVRIDENEKPYVLDFGLATDPSDLVGARLTQTNQLIGSLPWMSPEQLRGHRDSVTTRSDVYSLGVILFEMLTGTHPYWADTPLDFLGNITEADPQRPSVINSQINGEIDAIALRCMASDPSRRYQVAGEVAQDVRRYLQGEPIDAKRDSVLYVLRKRLVKHWMRVAIGFGVILLLILGVAYSLTYRDAVAWKEERDDYRLSTLWLFCQEMPCTCGNPNDAGRDDELRDYFNVVGGPPVLGWERTSCGYRAGAAFVEDVKIHGFTAVVDTSDRYKGR